MEKHVLEKGINLGGWLSQYRIYDHSHFKTFIQKKDIRRIAAWGFDHVRLPVDYPLFEDDRKPGEYLQSGFAYVQKCIDWCRRSGLRIILDLHKAPGYAFDDQQSNRLENDRDLQDRFVELWLALAKEFKSADQDVLAFELLNEINFQSSKKWNGMVEKTLRGMRAMDPERLIVVGGNCFNSVDYLSEIQILPDAQILYAFHFYLPHSVTHQKAYWFEGLDVFDSPVDYPGVAVGLKSFLKDHPQYQDRLGEDVDVHFDRSYLEKRIEPALHFLMATRRALYCGEFGVIDRAPMGTRENWTRDVVSILKDHYIGYAYWTYKMLDFGLVNEAGEIINQKLIDILVG